MNDGSVDLDSPTPRTPAWKPDFSGMWFSNVPSVAYCRTEDCIMEERMAGEQVNIGRNLPGIAIARTVKDAEGNGVFTGITAVT